MNRLQRAAVVVSLVKALEKNGSWCGDTHVQKGTFILQELLHVPLEFAFSLYKYGPYSFDLNDELAAFRAGVSGRVELLDGDLAGVASPFDDSISDWRCLGAALATGF